MFNRILINTRRLHDCIGRKQSWTKEPISHWAGQNIHDHRFWKLILFGLTTTLFLTMLKLSTCSFYTRLDIFHSRSVNDKNELLFFGLGVPIFVNTLSVPEVRQLCARLLVSISAYRQTCALHWALSSTRSWIISFPYFFEIGHHLW